MVNTMNSEELERIRNVTSNYFFWQGLRWVPVGLIILAYAFKLTKWWPFAGRGENVFLILLIALVAAVSPLIGRYYRRTFGDVRDDSDTHRRRESIKWVLVYPLMIASLFIDMLYQPRFFVTGPVWAGGILAYWFSTGRGRPHYIVAALCMLVLGPVQWIGFVEPKQMFSLFYVLLGATYVIGGLLDHRELSRILRPVKDTRDGAYV